MAQCWYCLEAVGAMEESDRSGWQHQVLWFKLKLLQWVNPTADALWISGKCCVYFPFVCMLWTWRVVYLHVVVVVVVEFCLCFEHVVFYSRVHFCLQLAREKEKCIRESVIFSVVVILWLYKIWVCEFEWIEMHFEFVPKFHDLVICYFIHYYWSNTI